MSTWRDHCRPIIKKVLEQNKGKPDKEIKQALLDAYPYKIWLDEIKVQRGLKKGNQELEDPNQTELF